MTALIFEDAKPEAESHRIGQQEDSYIGDQSPSTAFDARDRLDGKLDDTTVRQAVLSL